MLGLPPEFVEVALLPKLIDQVMVSPVVRPRLDHAEAPRIAFICSWVHAYDVSRVAKLVWSVKNKMIFANRGTGLPVDVLLIQ